MEVYVDLKDHIDIAAECERLEKQQQKLSGLIQGKEKKLSNENFVQRAPEDVVQRERENLLELQQQLSTVKAALESLNCK